jgi:hypothetical protein
MARKKTEKKPVQATELEMRFVRLQLPIEEHKKLRRLAADKDTNMALLAREVVLAYIEKNWKGAAK